MTDVTVTIYRYQIAPDREEVCLGETTQTSEDERELHGYDPSAEQVVHSAICSALVVPPVTKDTRLSVYVEFD